MGWWGKVIGGTFGYFLGGPLGAVLGAALGHNFDRGLSGLREAPLRPGQRERVQTAFFTATFSVMGHMAKADGRVSEDEIDAARAVMAQMQLSEEMRQTAISLFNEGKQDGFPLDDVLVQFKKECHRRHSLIRMFIEIQLQAAYADGALHPAEKRVLLQICEALGVSRGEFTAMDAMIRAERQFYQRQRQQSGATVDTGSAYAILGVDSNASDDEVKKAYRRLLNQHHPDKLVAKGLPEEMMKLATQKTHEIKQAYEQVKRTRGLK